LSSGVYHIPTPNIPTGRGTCWYVGSWVPTGSPTCGSGNLPQVPLPKVGEPEVGSPTTYQPPNSGVATDYGTQGEFGTLAPPPLLLQ